MKKQNNVIGITKIYLITNCYGDPNKVYIGKTKNNRQGDHKKRFGNMIEYTYIDEVNSLNYKDWEPLESYWIEQFRQWGFKMMNVRKKGGSGPEFLTEKQKLNLKKPKPKNHGYKVSLALKGKKKTKEHCINISKSKKSLKLKYTKEHCNKISKAKKGHVCYNHIWKQKISKSLEGKIRSENVKEKMRRGKSQDSIIKLSLSKSQSTKKKMSQAKIGKPKFKTVLQYDLEGNFIKEWSSIKEPSIYYNILPNNIIDCCKNKQKTSAGYKWKYKI